MEVGKLRPRDRLGLIQATPGQKQHSHHLLGLHSVTAWGHLLGKRHETAWEPLAEAYFWILPSLPGMRWMKLKSKTIA